MHFFQSHSTPFVDIVLTKDGIRNLAMLSLSTQWEQIYLDLAQLKDLLHQM